MPFSGYLDALATSYLSPELVRLVLPAYVEANTLRFEFGTHFHPFVQRLIDALNEGSLAGLQAADTEYVRDPATGAVQTLPDGRPRPVAHVDEFAELFRPGSATARPLPVQDLDFSGGGAYAVYNWELFYHLPMTVAIQLSRNGRHAEAQRWLHFVFDPTDTSGDPAPERYWKAKPLRQADIRRIEELLVNLSTAADPALRDETVRAIQDWQDNPFQPHRVARIRQTPYQYKAVTAYLDNLIAWGDSLFQQDTGETINEATQLYVLAANILGPRPQAVPKKGTQRARSYADLRGDLDEFGNALRELEADLPFDLAPRTGRRPATAALATLRGMGATLYFGVPRNDKLLGYWDTVADRLFKIRNSLTLTGTFRAVPTFDPPIDPALLARATAAGVDVGAVVAGLNQPLPLVRFSALVGRATELCQEVKNLGGQLLSALEKQDGERLAVLRAGQEKAILSLAEAVRYSQLQEAGKAREGLEQSLANATARYLYLQKQLGNDAVWVPVLEALDTAGLGRLSFRSTEPTVSTVDISVDIAADLNAAGGKIVSSHERAELGHIGNAHIANEVSHGLEALRAALSLIPQFEVAGKPIGVGGAVGFGGKQLADVVASGAAVARAIAEKFNYEATLSARIGGYGRREQDWRSQSNTVAGEMSQIYKQLRAAQIREAIAEREWHNHQRQIANAEEIELFLTDDRVGKITNEAFYGYLKREVRGLYAQCFALAHEQARKAERALRSELGDASVSFLGTGYLAGREGLLAGERLYQDIKRMELAYQDRNAREYELTTHVSLRTLDPVELLRLRATGRCTISVPEEWFDLDCPGHYFRRIRSVAVSVPCVVGPFATVNCTLTQLRSTIRTSAALTDRAYARHGDDTERFSDHFGSLQSIVTSTGTNDSGLFETNMRDERYLPFEATGAISEWQLDLPDDVPRFDHDTITDVILHLRYTARQGGDPLRSAAVANLRTAVDNASTAGSARMLSLRQEFPGEWAAFAAAGSGDLTVRLRDQHYPYWSRIATPLTLKRLDVLARPTPGATGPRTVAGGAGPATPLEPDPTLGGILAATLPTPLPDAVGELGLSFDSNEFDDVWLILTWGGE